MKAAALFVLPALAGCTSVELPADSKATFDPIAFFAGPTEGRGALHKAFSDPVPLHVHGVGTGNRDRLRLTQQIAEGSKALRRRTWVIRRVAPGRFTATLTDAIGPVAVSVTGPRATIRYRTRDGLTIDQQLALQTDPSVVCNLLEVRKYGVRVAWARETIRRTGAATAGGPRRPTANC